MLPLQVVFLEYSHVYSDLSFSHIRAGAQPSVGGFFGHQPASGRREVVYVRLCVLRMRVQQGFPSQEAVATREEVHVALEERLKDMSANGPVPDVLTFAGNGEPTLHPHFPEIIEDTRALRDRYFPKAKISVLSNATQIFRPEVFEALGKVDNNILKLDTVDGDYISRVDRPTGRYEVGRWWNA